MLDGAGVQDHRFGHRRAEHRVVAVELGERRAYAVGAELLRDRHDRDVLAALRAQAFEHGLGLVHGLDLFGRARGAAQHHRADVRRQIARQVVLGRERAAGRDHAHRHPERRADDVDERSLERLGEQLADSPPPLLESQGRRGTDRQGSHLRAGGRDRRQVRVRDVSDGSRGDQAKKANHHASHGSHRIICTRCGRFES